MASWSEVERQGGDLAALARARIEATGLALLATLRADGSPRISGIEPLFASGELYLGMMDGSRKAADLARDPRFALHNATEDKDVTHGDAKISGRANEVTTSPDHLTAFTDAFAAAHEGMTDEDIAEFLAAPMHLFRCDVTEVSTIKPAGDHLDIDTWTVDRGITHVDRF